MPELDPDTPRIPAELLKRYVIDVLQSFGMRPWDAEISADILVESDLRGIDSHGVPRMTFYAYKLRQGMINLQAELTVVRESAATLTLDADNGFGPPMAHQAMARTIEK